MGKIGGGDEKFPGLLDPGAQRLWYQKPGRSPDLDAVRLRGCDSVTVGGVMRVGMFRQVLCTEVVSPNLNLQGFYRDGWGHFPYPML